MYTFKYFHSLLNFFRKANLKIFDTWENIQTCKLFFIRKDFPIFWPNSAGATREKTSIALRTIDNVFMNLASFSNYELLSVDQFRKALNRNPDSRQLEKLFVKYGSDKSTSHNYEKVYEVLFENTQSVTKVFEVGIGSTNLQIVSNMGSLGNPGASLRAFRDYFENAEIFGADIDQDILFTEHRINTLYLDQLSPKQFDEDLKSIGSEFDLVIDDGLHAIDANLNILFFFMPLLKNDGFLVIEDIPKAAAPFWLTMARFISDKGESWLIDTKGGMLFVFQKTG